MTLNPKLGLRAFAGLAAIYFFTGCASTQPVGGFIYSDVAGPVAATTNQMGPKHGVSCASSYLGAVALGDASISAAAKNGGIANISHVEQHSSSLLFFYTKYCLDVWGYGPRGGATAAPAAPAPAAGTKPGANNVQGNALQTAAVTEDTGH